MITAHMSQLEERLSQNSPVLLIVVYGCTDNVQELLCIAQSLRCLLRLGSVGGVQKTDSALGLTLSGAKLVSRLLTIQQYPYRVIVISAFPHS
jgi:hypothetical protein